ncbi:hypothetical protein C0J52_11749 [Blattella germanica]|nr:hypothetical protein C0J52_11749 [Blattella germanica]
MDACNLHLKTETPNIEDNQTTFPNTVGVQSEAPYGQQHKLEIVLNEEKALTEESVVQKSDQKILQRNYLNKIEYIGEQENEETKSCEKVHFQQSCESLNLQCSNLSDQFLLKGEQEKAFLSLLQIRSDEGIRKAKTPQQFSFYSTIRRSNETQEERELRLSKLRDREAQRRANETPEQRAYRLSQNCKYAKEKRANLSQEEREEHLLQGRLYEAQRRANETPDKREQRLIRMRLSEARRRANETPEERERRLSRTRLSEAQRRANETPDERTRRLIRMRVSEAQRRANETPEERTHRLIRLRFNEAIRRANETPEEREQRLQRTRLNEARRRAKESSEERECRLNRMRITEARRRATETSEEREQRLLRARLRFSHQRTENSNGVKKVTKCLSITNDTLNKAVELNETCQKQLSVSKIEYGVPEKQEHFLLNMHLSKSQDGKESVIETCEPSAEKILHCTKPVRSPENEISNTFLYCYIYFVKQIWLEELI